MDVMIVSLESLSKEELANLVLLGQGVSQNAFDLLKDQYEKDQATFLSFVKLAKETKSAETAGTIIDFLKEATFDFYPYDITRNKELAYTAVHRNDDGALSAFEAFAELTTREYHLEDKNYLIHIICESKNAKLSLQALGLLKTIYLEKRDKYITLETFWDIHLNCKFKTASFEAFKVCLHENYFQSWTERDYLAAFRYHDVKRN